VLEGSPDRQLMEGFGTERGIPEQIIPERIIPNESFPNEFWCGRRERLRLVRRSLNSCRLLAVRRKGQRAAMAGGSGLRRLGQHPAGRAARTAESRLECWLGALGIRVALRSPGGLHSLSGLESREDAARRLSPVFSFETAGNCVRGRESYGAADQDRTDRDAYLGAGGPSHGVAGNLP